MNTPLQAMEQPQPSGAFASVGAATEHKLPQSGGRPLIFAGNELAMAMSFTPGLPYWFEVNLYHSQAQEFVVAVRKFFQSENENDYVNSWSFPSIDAALSHIQNYDPAIDILIPEMDTDMMTPAEMSAIALSLRAEVEAVRHHYSGLVGELFMELDAVEDSIG